MHSAEQVTDVVVKAWADALGEPATGPADSFFDLGGDSMMAVMMIERIELELGVTFPIEVMFVDDTLGGVIKTFIAQDAGEMRG